MLPSGDCLSLQEKIALAVGMLTS